LLASAAIPVVFESIEIDGEWFVDGGANGDNIPVRPLEKEDVDCIVVIHLSNKPATIATYKGDVIEVFPSKHLGGLFDGTLDFDSQSVNERMDLGYHDTQSALMNLADLCYRSRKTEDVKVKGRTNKEKKFSREDIRFNYMEDEEMADFKFTCEDAREKYEAKLVALQKIADDNSVDSAYLWDATVQKYAAKMTKVNSILNQRG
jgi:NTE family protein